MADDHSRAVARRSRMPALVLALTAIGAAKAGLWFYFRDRQPSTDAQARDRLQPRRGRP